MILERLRAETRPLHEHTEQLLYTDALRGGLLTADQYGHLLLTHGAYHQSLERAIDQHPLFFALYDPESRRKSAWLRTDLAGLGLNLPATLPNPFANWSPVALLGAAYVGEGSMLGGKTVWAYLQQSRVLQPLLPGARFYRGYGPETGPLWRSFGQFITQRAADEPDVVVEAAGRAFLAYHTLFKQTQGISVEAADAFPALGASA